VLVLSKILNQLVEKTLFRLKIYTQRIYSFSCLSTYC